jgi:serine/threonine-protein phosphatase 5
VVTKEFVEGMLEEFKAQKTIHKRFAFEIIKQVWGLFSTRLSMKETQRVASNS